jgi:hypothetical protein
MLIQSVEEGRGSRDALLLCYLKVKGDKKTRREEMDVRGRGEERAALFVLASLSARGPAS